MNKTKTLAMILSILSILSCEPFKGQPLPQQDVIVFSEKEIFIKAIYTKGSKSKIKTIKLGKLEGNLVSTSCQQKGNVFTYASTNKTNVYELNTYEINLTTHEIRQIEKQNYIPGKHLTFEGKIEKYKYTPEGKFELINTIDVDRYRPWGIYYCKEYNDTIPLFGEKKTIAGKTLFTEKGSLYMANQQGEKDTLFKHTGQYNLKFGGGCYAIAIDPTATYALFSYRPVSMSWKGEGELKKVDLTTKEVTTIAPKECYFDKQFSDNGEYLLFRSDNQIYIMNLQSKQKIKLAKGKYAKWLEKKKIS